MVKEIRREYSNGKHIVDYTCTSTTDIGTLPKQSTDSLIGIGSTCICTEDGSIWMLGADDAWHKL